MNDTLLSEHLERARLRRALPDPDDRRQLRELLGLSQQQLADVLEVSRVTVVRWETGTRNPSPALLTDYLKVLGVSA